MRAGEFTNMYDQGCRFACEGLLLAGSSHAFADLTTHGACSSELTDGT
jgi:hypothetical protein